MKQFNIHDNIFVLSAVTKGNQPKWFKDNYYIKADAIIALLGDVNETI